MSVHDDFEATLERLVEWANSIRASKRDKFERIAKLMSEHHFGIQHVSIDCFEDIGTCDDSPEMEYLNTGDTYSLTLALTDDYVNGCKLLITTWGDWYEEQERWIYEEYGYQRCAYCSHLGEVPEGKRSEDVRCEHCGHAMDGQDWKR